MGSTSIQTKSFKLLKIFTPIFWYVTKVPEDRASESFAQVGDYPVGHTKAMRDVSDELCGFFRCYFRNSSDFNPLGEFVDGDQYMFVAAWGGTKRCYSIETPHSEGS
jgi:hypothetical protein